MSCWSMKNAAGPAELRPDRQQFAVLVEYLDAIVAPIADEQPAPGIHRQRVRSLELARPAAMHAPLPDEFAVVVELDDTGIPSAWLMPV